MAVYTYRKRRRDQVPTVPSATGLEPLKERSNLPIRAVSVFVLLLVAYFGQLVFSNENMQWDVVGIHIFSQRILEGVLVTVYLTVTAMALGVVVGMATAAARMSSIWALRALAIGFIQLLRSTPLLVQLLFWYSLALLFPVLSFGIPFTDLMVSGSTNTLITTFVAAMLGLALHEGAFAAEIIRGGLLGVPKGQSDAARSIGMTKLQTARRIILPQSLRMIVPPMGNQVVRTLLATSLVAFIAGNDLMSTAEKIYSVDLAVIPLLLVVTFWYLVLAGIAMLGQRLIERHYNKGYS